MREQLTRLLGLEGFVVTAVEQRGDWLELEGELVTVAVRCARCGWASVEVKERPLVRVRDLPISGREAVLCWRKRRFQCEGCGRSFSEQHPELPSRQRVTRRFVVVCSSRREMAGPRWETREKRAPEPLPGRSRLRARRCL